MNKISLDQLDKMIQKYEYLYKNAQTKATKEEMFIVLTALKYYLRGK